MDPWDLISLDERGPNVVWPDIIASMRISISLKTFYLSDLNSFTANSASKLSRLTYFMAFSADDITYPTKDPSF